MSLSTTAEISKNDQTLIADLDGQIRRYVRKHGNAKDLELLEQAIADIRKYHGEDRRKSGQPFIVHPFRVARYICRAGLDAPTVIAALLHDLIEDTPVSHDDIAERYGTWYADIVKGLTKIKYPENSGKNTSVDLDATYQRMLSAMAQDVRTLFIKLFDRLDNMRDMDSMPGDKQRSISKETLGVYVPMAERLGLTRIGLEHTELCFKLLYPRRYQKTLKAIESLKQARLPTIRVIQEALESALENQHLAFLRIEPIFVHPASRVYEKGPLERVLESFRITLSSSMACYQALGILHSGFTVIPLKIRDYISNPLWNGYEAMRTELKIEGEQTGIEIVSKEMQEKNQYGIMAHWQGSPTELADYYRTYLNQLDQLAGEKDIRMLDVLRYVQSEQVQVYSPKGEMFALPKGATVLDFAYTIHSELGNHCIGALVNPSAETTANTNKRVPRERQLFNGETLQILTDSKAHPSKKWFEQIRITKSKNEIRRALVLQKVAGARKSGRDTLERKLREGGEEQEVESWLKSEAVIKALKTENLSVDKFLQEIGLQKRPLRPFLKKYKLLNFEASFTKVGRLRKLMYSGFWENFFGRGEEQFLIEDLQDPLIRFATCCSPIPGDKIVGFVKDDIEIEVHLLDCRHLIRNEKQPQPNNVPIAVAWNLSKNSKQPHIIYLLVKDGTGVLYQITKIIKDAGVAIVDSQTAKNKNSPYDAEIHIHLEPMTWQIFHKIVEGVRGLKFVKKVWEEPAQ